MKTLRVFPAWTGCSALLGGLFLLASGVGCEPGWSPPRALTEAERALVERTNGFGFSLLVETARREPGAEATVISPLSVSYALGMTLNGAAGETHAEMRSLLGYDSATLAEINETYRGLMDVLAATDPAVAWSLANSLWIDTDEGFRLLPEFAAVCRRSFRAEAREIDLQDPSAVEAINRWVDRATGGRIDQMFEAPFADEIRLILLNALYFKARWALEFDPLLTRDGMFHAADGKAMPVRLMTLEAELPYLSTPDLQAVHLAYDNGSFGLTLLLPGPDSSIEAVLEQLAAGAWSGWWSGLAPSQGKLELPRFTLRWSGQFIFPLRALGMVKAFEPELADFSAMAERARERKLHVAFVDQRTWLSLDEQGTEAAAATAVGMEELDSYGSGSFQMRVDRPFVLVLHERRSGAVILAGAVYSLTSS
jgi:serpin B